MNEDTFTSKVTKTFSMHRYKAKLIFLFIFKQHGQRHDWSLPYNNVKTLICSLSKTLLN